MEKLLKDRAWIEINIENLIYNIKQIQKLISNKTKIMAVIKANAYGHGMIECAKTLESIGIQDFAVATLGEGIKLRENNIKGNILILGYTDFDNLEYVIKNDLVQTIVDYEYYKKIPNLKEKLKCHIKINTGMNRIGEKYNETSKIVEMFESDKLNVLGIYSHLCVSDSNELQDIEFTKKQIENFKRCSDKLELLGYKFKTHIQNSYGILNYCDLNFDYVRAGIIMYTSDLNSKIDTKPVLTLKSRITSIKKIKKDETVGYGRIYKAEIDKIIATVSIGYADGYPRCLSNKNTKVRINNEYASIIGNICMDQMMIDVTNIKNVKIGDVVTLIEDDLISVEELAKSANTITYEILSRLGNRLPRIYKMSKIVDNKLID